MKSTLSRSHLLRREFWLQRPLPLGVRIAPLPALGPVRVSVASGAPAHGAGQQVKEVRHG